MKLKSLLISFLPESFRFYENKLSLDSAIDERGWLSLVYRFL